MNAPVPTKDLLQWIPHRPPMVWIDRVTSFNNEGGRCSVTLKDDALYMAPEGKLRPSSMIEFIAQAFGFVSLCQNHAELSQAGGYEKAFLVGVRDANLRELRKNPPTVGDTLTIEVGNVKHIAQIQIVEGRVFNAKMQLLASADLKVYSE